MNAIKPIPIEAAKRVAEAYGYDQVIIIGRRIGTAPDPHGEHITTYGRNLEHCRAAALISAKLQKLFGRKQEENEPRKDPINTGRPGNAGSFKKKDPAL